ncbi:MAG: M23 family metallopeptidase [Patescibacteria group bacterium]
MTNKNKVWIVFLAILIIVLIVSAYFINRQIKNNKSNIIQNTPTITPTNSSPIAAPTTITTQAFAEPIAQFKQRITKKPFGIYITPENSPVSPERFTGFHTGVDVEYQDVDTDVPVYALADGAIVLSRTASGYGGVLIIDFKLDGVDHTALYGHLRPESLPQVGQSFKKGEQIAVLGTGYSSETDNERRHLHFAILSDNRVDLKGYVQNESELSGWIDPLTLYK